MSDTTMPNCERDSLEPPISVETLASLKNDPLLASDAIVARKWLLAAETELERVGREIQALESRRWKLLAHSNAYRLALAPHKILPDDILREIFVLCAQADTTEPSALRTDLTDVGLESLKIRLTISHVSFRWRSVALQTHELWNDVQLFIWRADITPLLNLIDLWLSRSGQYPLSWGFRDMISLWNIAVLEKGCVDRIGEMLARCSHRFLYLSVDSPPLLDVVLDLPPGSFSLLQDVLLGGWDNTASRLPGSVTAFAGSPLRGVTFNGVAKGESLQALALPWHQLSELKIQSEFPSSQYYYILDQCKALTSAWIRISDSALPTNVGPGGISLPQLRTLHLESDFLVDAQRLLHMISAPSLTHLTIDFEEAFDMLTGTVPSFPALQRICITGFLQDPLPWLRGSNSVVEVCMPSCMLTDSDLDEMAEGSLLPNVTLLTIEASPRIIAMLEARLTSCTYSTITHVGITDESFVLTAGEMESLVKLMAAGVFLADCSATSSEREQTLTAERLKQEHDIIWKEAAEPSNESTREA
ncbi:hypothetical protein B0H11DRAFT_2198118 [Mycena galericulata]|nr:hypothetical protein B0H11DRAFT_2198118 [Mycena galericulata]